MKISTIIVAALLSLVAFDGRRSDALELRGVEEELTLGSVERRQKRRVLQRHRLDVIPRWARGQAVLRQKVNHYVNKSRDPRDSNQRKIRRKFNNM